MPDSKRDYYEVLEIQKNADEAEIKKAFRTLAKKYHPDMNPNDKNAEKNFKEVNEAYEVLSNPEKRQNYDSYGHAGVDPNMNMGQGFGGFGGFGNFGSFDVSDILSDLFGGGSSSPRNRNAPQRGEDIYQKLMISFEEAAFGCTKEISYSKIETCEECSGSGASKGSSVDTCSVCNGSGILKKQTRTPIGIMQNTTTCDNCHGTGKTIKSPCNVCKGNGLVRKNTKKEVVIPAGIDDGQKMKVTGQGSAGKNGGPVSDLIISIGVRPHSIFEREDYNLFCEIPITFVEATLGAEIDVPTLEGSVKYHIPEGTQNASVFTLRNQGIQHINSPKSRGDLYVKTLVEIPTGLSEKQKNILREFSESCGNKNHSKKESFFKKFKK